MYEFIYHIKFKIVNEKLDIKIFLSLEDLFTPVYLKTYDNSVLKDKLLFSSLYYEVVEYIDNKQIVINEDDLRLLHQTLVNFNMELPKIILIDINKYDEELDSYSHILTPKELIFIQYADGKAINDKRFKTWENDNNLSTKELKEKLLKKKILTTDNYEFNLRKAKRELLLEVVEKHNLDIHGDNNDLIEGIIKDVKEEIIKEYFTGTHYTLTKKGKAILKKSGKILDFNRSYYRTINKLSLEEFHLLSIKKEDYDFNGIGRLLMINNNNKTQYFDWNMLNNIEELINNEKPDDILSLIDQINNNYDDKKNVEEIEKETENTVDITDEDLFIEENLKIKQQLEAYKQKKEVYENQNKDKVSLYSEEVYSEKSRNKFLIFIIVFLSLLILSFGLLFLNEKFDLVNLPFKLKDIYGALEKAFNYVKDKITGLFK